MTPSELFDAAMRTGRRTILGDDAGGIVAPDKPADLVELDFAAITDDCVRADNDPMDLLLGRMSAKHVRRLIVAGRDVVSGGRCVTIDVPEMERALTDFARSAAPPDTARLRRLQAAVQRFYDEGHHRGCC